MDKKKIFVSTKKPFEFSKNRVKVVILKVLVGTHSLLAQALLGPEGLTPVYMTDGKKLFTMCWKLSGEPCAWIKKKFLSALRSPLNFQKEGESSRQEGPSRDS